MFERLNESKIDYCHFKSNMSINKGLNGQTDLDILVDIDKKQEFQLILSEYKFISIKTSPIKSTHEVYDYLGYDTKSCRLIHLHVHYKFVIGEKYIKNYFIPIEKYYFKNSTSIQSVKVPDPNLELLVLIIRMHLKLDWFDMIRFVKYRKLYPDMIYSEFLLLNKKYSPKKFCQYAELLFTSEEIDYLLKIRTNLLEDRSMFRGYQNKIYFKRLLSKYRLEKGCFFYLRKFYLSFRYFKYIQKVKSTKKKTFYKEGYSIALVGADGSGKSTIANELRDWFYWKIEVENLYFGIPKKSVLLKIISLSRKAFNLFFGKISNKFKKSVNRILISFFWIIVALKRKIEFNRMIRYKKKSGLVIIHRFPLEDFDNMDTPMDRPRIKKINKNESFISRIEENLYSNITHPNIIFILQSDLDTLRKRKNNITINEHSCKVEAINGIKNKNNIVRIDATRPYDEVIGNIKKITWGMINESY